VILVQLMALIKVREKCQKMHATEAKSMLVVLVDPKQDSGHDNLEELDLESGYLQVKTISIEREQINGNEAQMVPEIFEAPPQTHCDYNTSNNVPDLAEDFKDNPIVTTLENNEIFSSRSLNMIEDLGSHVGTYNNSKLILNDLSEVEDNRKDNFNTKFVYSDDGSEYGSDAKKAEVNDIASIETMTSIHNMNRRTKKIKKIPKTQPTQNHKKSKKAKTSASKNWVRIFFMMVVNLITSEEMNLPSNKSPEVRRFLNNYTSRKIDSQTKLYGLISKSEFWRGACLECLENHYEEQVSLSREIEDKEAYKGMKERIKAKLRNPGLLHH